MCTTFAQTRTFVVISCCRCGVDFGVPRALNEENLKDHTRFFWCPNGHQQHYLGETALQRMEKTAKRAQELLDHERLTSQQLRESRERAERQTAAARGQVTRIKNRIKNGVCPCCNRTFANLAAHIHTKHPDYVHLEAPVNS